MTDPGVVIAVGGNALAPASEEGTIAEQFRHTRESLGVVVGLAAQGWRIAIVHGNGPQVGDALTQQELARDVVPPLHLGVLVAATGLDRVHDPAVAPECARGRRYRPAGGHGSGNLAPKVEAAVRSVREGGDGR